MRKGKYKVISSTTKVILTTAMPPTWFKYANIFDNRIIVKLPKRAPKFYPLLVKIGDDWNTNYSTIYKRFEREVKMNYQEWKIIFLSEIMKYDMDLALDWFTQKRYYTLNRARSILEKIFSDNTFSNSLSINIAGILINSRM